VDDKTAVKPETLSTDLLQNHKKDSSSLNVFDNGTVLLLPKFRKILL
jgi:hypothetical protein